MLEINKIYKKDSLLVGLPSSHCTILLYWSVWLCYERKFESCRNNSLGIIEKLISWSRSKTFSLKGAKHYLTKFDLSLVGGGGGGALCRGG